jgi:hypothetical protein
LSILPETDIFPEKSESTFKDASSWPKIHLTRLSRLGQDAKDAKDEIAVLLILVSVKFTRWQSYISLALPVVKAAPKITRAASDDVAAILK